MHSQVADRLTDEGGMDAYQREILEKALRFYEGVALPQSPEPEVRYETGRARFRVAEIRYKSNQMKEAQIRAGERCALFLRSLLVGFRFRRRRPTQGPQRCEDLIDLSLQYAEPSLDRFRREELLDNTVALNRPTYQDALAWPQGLFR